MINQLIYDRLEIKKQLNKNEILFDISIKCRNMYVVAINLKKQMKIKITLTSLPLFAKCTPRQTSKVLPSFFSVKRLAKKVN